MAEEMRGKETRERERDNKNRNGKQRGDYDVLGSRKQERFVNLEKNGGKKKPQQQPQPKQEEETNQDTGPSGETYHQRSC